MSISINIREIVLSPPAGRSIQNPVDTADNDIEVLSSVDETLDEKKKKKKDDRCVRIAKRKYDTWPSAYASGAVVRCRRGEIWKGIKEGNCSDEPEEGYIVEIELDEKKKKAGTESSKESSLRDWFKRKGAKGKTGGWVDCNTCRKDKKTGRTKCKACGREKGEKRAKYPACRPTPSACKEQGRGKSWGKKTAKGKKG